MKHASQLLFPAFFHDYRYDSVTAPSGWPPRRGCYSQSRRAVTWTKYSQKPRKLAPTRWFRVSTQSKMKLTRGLRSQRRIAEKPSRYYHQ
jgi:hypothetical protein